MKSYKGIPLKDGMVVKTESKNVTSLKDVEEKRKSTLESEPIQDKEIEEDKEELDSSKLNHMLKSELEKKAKSMGISVTDNMTKKYLIKEIIKSYNHKA